MAPAKIRITILLGVFSLISILLTQLYWVNKSLSVQERNIAIQERADSLNLTQFSEQVHIALRNSLQQISTDLSDSSDLYGAVHQVSANYYTVDINEELHPYYLEGVLKREFYAQSINKNFQYGIYDCFTDSIVYGNLVTYSEDTQYEGLADDPHKITPNLKWEKKDGHYFTVYFPTVDPNLAKFEKMGFTNGWYLLLVIMFPLAFFVYSIFTIIHQKRVADVKNDFINNMTHELKTPIATIGLSSEMLMKGSVTEVEDVQRYAGLIYKENKRLQNQVERVLKIAKMDKEKVELAIEKVDIHEIVTEAKDAFEFNNVISEGRFELDLQANPCVIDADALHLENIIYNLIDNAIKYCDKDPYIIVSTRVEKRNFIMEITDNGIGIKKEQIKHIFEKFYRVSTGNLHNVKGFGLGLYYVKLVVEAHKGSIEVKSVVGKGTTMRLVFPLEQKALTIDKFKKK